MVYRRARGRAAPRRKTRRSTTRRSRGRRLQTIGTAMGPAPYAPFKGTGPRMPLTPRGRKRLRFSLGGSQTTTRKRRRRNQLSSMSAGVYTGTFPATRRARADKKLFVGFKESRNWVQSLQEHECAHIGVSPLRPTMVMRVACGALLRHYWKVVYRGDIIKEEDLLGFFTSGTITTTMAFGLTDTAPATGNGVNSIYTHTFTTSLDPLTNTSSLSFRLMLNEFYGRVVYLLDQTHVRINWIEINTNRTGEANNPSLDYQDVGKRMYIDRMYCDLKAYATIRLQNITNSDDNQGSRDDITANPVHGYIYKHSSPQPILKYAGVNANWMNALERVVNGREVRPEGVIQPYIDWAPGPNPGDVIPSYIEKTEEFYRPPDSTIFTTCTGRTRFGLNPGEMKQVTVPFIYNGTFLRLLENIHQQMMGEVTRNSFGTCIMFAFSKRMPTGSIPVQYNLDCSWDCTSVVYSRKVAFQKDHHIVYGPNNVTLTT